MNGKRAILVKPHIHSIYTEDRALNREGMKAKHYTTHIPAWGAWLTFVS